MLFRTNIKRRVMKVVSERIALVQKHHDEELKIMKEEHKNALKALEDGQRDKETVFTDSVVGSLTDSFIAKR